MRIYEELFIVKPDITDGELDPLIDQLKQVITGSGGVIDKADKWGVRRLAYRVQKKAEGYYVLVQFHSNPDVVKEIERRLRVSDIVLKFLTVRIDEKLKRLEKLKKFRENRAARKPAPAPAAAPALPSETPAPVPAAPVARVPEKE
jgi:small subunit ribosomal protein S6